ncbi:MAG: hypothetical protein ACOVKV_09545, partial [Novosphingobium sp.]
VDLQRSFGATQCAPDPFCVLKRSLARLFGNENPLCKENPANRDGPPGLSGPLRQFQAAISDDRP